MLKSLLLSLGRKRADAAYAKRFRLARAAFDQGEHAHAESEFLSLAGQITDDPEAWLYAGLGARERGAMEDALARFARACALDPANHHYRFAEAHALAALGRADACRRACMRVVELAPEFNPAYMLWASLELPGEDYFAFLARLHAHLRPATYVEIGVFRGRSLQLIGPGTRAVGVDPAPQLAYPVPPKARVAAMTSDAFFASVDLHVELGGVVELAFIDGMHRFEFALRDFIHIERASSPAGTILIHDCYPLSRGTATPERETGFWSGDIWRLILILKKYRPDLQVHTLALAPTGLGMVRGLDPGSTVLGEGYDRIVEEFTALDYAILDADKAGKLNLFPNRWDDILPLLSDCAH